MPNQNLNDNIARAGLDTDNVIGQIEKGYVTDALNAINGSFDGQQVTYQNEEGNTKCVVLPAGYKCIGVKNVMQIDQVWYLLTNSTTGYSYIGYVFDNGCTFVPVLDDSVPGSDLLNFDINYPVRKIEVKNTNCSTQLYWTDRYNHRRYLDLNNLPWKTGTTNQIDVNKMEVQPLFSIPDISPTAQAIGGTLIEGDYQFAIQYASIKGEGLTSWYSVTNPVRIFLNSKISADYNLQTNYAIELEINRLDTTGLYNYFNIAAIKTINAVSTVELVGTFFILNDTYRHVYTGGEQSMTNIQLTLTDIMTQNDYYDLAGDLTQVDNTIVWADLVKEEDISFQKIFNQVKVEWATSKVPVAQGKGYTDGVICSEVEGYFRDEVYALEGCFLFNNGKQSARFHIPGRIATSRDREFVNNSDSNAFITATCPKPNVERWKIYNTGSITGYLSGSSDPCTGIIPWQHGQMSYWESEELYPANTAIWGPLANQPIRHHKFPDSALCPIFEYDGLASSYYVFPIGFKVDIQSLYNAIMASPDLTPAQKRSIVGFKIMRSDRAADRSIVAKGLFYNMGQYEKQGQGYYYANYPFNDVRPDPFISSQPVNNESGAHDGTPDNTPDTRLQNFQKSRYTFHSPDTHFFQPQGIQGSLLNLETAYQGTCKSHFIRVQNNAGEKLLTDNAMYVSLAVAMLSTLGLDFETSNSTSATVPPVVTTTLTVTPRVNFQNFIPTYNNMLEVINKITPYYNYGWQYNGVGYYDSSVGIPTDVGNKIRFIKFGGYINSGLQASFGDIYPINNTGRESSVFVSTDGTLPYTHEQVDIFGNNLNVAQDTSRTLASKENKCFDSSPFYKDVSSYYGSLKRVLPSQYGQIFSYRPIDTGTYGAFYDDKGVVITDHPIIYGGDCFINRFALKIKHPFYLKSTVDKPDGFDIDYNQSVDATGQPYTNTGNVGYPIWYYSTENIPFKLDPNVIGGVVNFTNAVNLTVFNPPPNVLTVIAGVIGFLPFAVVDVFQILLGLLASGANLFLDPGKKVTNLECRDNTNLYKQGMAYLYAYGIPFYFCESEVNVDMRQAYNLREGNFYPAVSTDIPDDWLQETNTPIAFDNTYTYNKTYSKQNHETAFTNLRPDWQPGQQCYITYNNRAIWSEASEMEDTRNNWLVYKPANTFDFPKSFGPLVAVDRLETRAVLVRYVNHSQLYNVQATIETTAINAALGTGALFSGTQPIDFNMSDSGYAGSQHKMLIQTEQGHIFVDAMRGQVILVRGTSVEELSSPKYKNSKWFQNNLPFNISRYFPEVPTDNNFAGIGLHGVYDAFYDRFILTKLDYSPYEGVMYDGKNFYVSENDRKTIVELGDPEYFCNKSWSMSFSFISGSWVSWHSYLPNFYVPHTNYFQSGVNNTCTVWNHNQNYLTFNKFYDTDYPYIIEYPFSYQYQDQLLQYIEEYATVLKYNSQGIYVEPNETVYFTQAIVYNRQASTGLLNLIPKDINNRAQYITYPKYNPDSVDILVTKVDHMYSYNMLWNNLVDSNIVQWTLNCTPGLGQISLNQSNFDYANASYKKYPLRAKDTRVREIMKRDDNPYKIISKFIISKTQNMFS
jgi:hypothetical protein